MESPDHPIEHFGEMTAIAKALKPLPAQVLEHHYHYSAFGSWWLVVGHRGVPLRIVFDGKEQLLGVAPDAGWGEHEPARVNAAVASTSHARHLRLRCHRGHALMRSVIRALSYSAWVAVVLCVALAGTGCIASKVRIVGNAMSPTLDDGERWPIVRTVDRVERGSIVVYYYPRDLSKSFVGRVIGLPGERITIRHGEVSVDGRRLDETYVATANRSAEDFEVAVPTDEYFLMGDNRRNSSDSRHWGAVPKALIWAKVVLP